MGAAIQRRPLFLKRPRKSFQSTSIDPAKRLLARLCAKGTEEATPQYLECRSKTTISEGLEDR